MSTPTITVSESTPLDQDDDQIEAAAKLELLSDIEEKHNVLPLRSIAELEASRGQVSYIVEGLLSSMQPAIIAGPEKSLKTTLAIGLGLSIASGRRFLEQFSILTSGKVAVFSAESGADKLMDTVSAWADGLLLNTREPEFSDRFKIATWVPHSSCEERLYYFKEQLKLFQPLVCIIDPMYLAIDDEQASISKNGQQMRRLSEIALHFGATPVFCDHIKKNSTNAGRYSPLELSDLSGAGKGAFFRQWMLISRRSKFTAVADRLHELWMTVGGSQGHSWQGAVDVREQFEGSRLSHIYAMVQPEENLRQQQARSIADRDADTRRRRFEEQEQRLAVDSQQLVEQMRRGSREPMTKTQIGEMMSWSGASVTRVIEHLVSRSILQLVPDSVRRGNGQQYDGYQLVEPGPEN